MMLITFCCGDAGFLKCVATETGEGRGGEDSDLWRSIQVILNKRNKDATGGGGGVGLVLIG